MKRESSIHIGTSGWHYEHGAGPFYSVDYSDWWFNIRSSRTESVLRVNIGATNKTLLSDKSKIPLTDIENISKNLNYG